MPNARMPSVWRSGCHCSSPSRTGSESTSSMRMTRAPWGMGPSWHGGPSRARRGGAAARGDARAGVSRRPRDGVVHPQRAPAPEVRGAVLLLAAAPAARPGAGARRRRGDRCGDLGAARPVARVQLAGAEAVRRAGARARLAPAVGCARRRAGGGAPPGRPASLPRSARNRPAGAGPGRRDGAAAARAGAVRPRWPTRVPGVVEGAQRRVLLALRVPRDRRGADAGRRADRVADVAGRGLTPAAVLFDNDGLLLDTEVLWTRAEVTLIERYGATFTIEHKRELIGTSGPV